MNRKQILLLSRRIKRYRRHLAERMGSNRYSQPALYQIDRRLAEIFGCRPGFFVEAGANDGFRQSNTYYLERFCGWSGVLVEPIPELYERCRRERPRSKVVHSALVADASIESIPMAFADLMSVVAGTKGEHESRWLAHGLSRVGVVVEPSYQVCVPAKTLTAVLDEVTAPTDPDLLSVDVEGYEVEVLRGLDLERYAFRCILVEIADGAHADAIDEILASSYEKRQMLSHHDALYRRR